MAWTTSGACCSRNRYAFGWGNTSPSPATARRKSSNTANASKRPPSPSRRYDDARAGHVQSLCLLVARLGDLVLDHDDKRVAVFDHGSRTRRRSDSFMMGLIPKRLVGSCPRVRGRQHFTLANDPNAPRVEICKSPVIRALVA